MTDSGASGSSIRQKPSWFPWVRSLSTKPSVWLSSGKRSHAIVWLIASVAALVGLGAATAARPALAAAKPPAPAIGPALQHQLLMLYAAYRRIPASDIAPVAPGG